ncbi:beta-agarase [Coraliomargarita akajimensis]|uniref:Beta-agarase n=1 Tax=Coraliomargarita akajimensis (strain DSM 45221 / IAM 15411 / JCM 23193 / KCTC 12865 / 04OKA010-24) TaxID=583355 RepID=D5EMJ0_CORAD|nr:beta-agarase [Coraliomargarita akajimensis]ADE53396.1 Beta-agarase [Coraliomargarita akajimensis DSM 45221]
MKPSLLSLSLLAPVIAFGAAEPVEVQLSPEVLRNIGGVTRFDRDQFITVHESYGSKDMTDDELTFMETVLDARYGRDGGFLSWQASETPADPNNPDMPDVEAIKRNAKAYQKTLAGRQRELSAKMRDVVICTHPELMHATEQNQFVEWGPRTYEGVAEFTAQFMKHFFSDSERPMYLEVFNEPFVKIKKIDGASVQTMSEQHNVVAKRVKELCPDVLVGGYAAAWIELEHDNFGHWDRWQKEFMDIAGENMDFFSYHLYDGVNVEGNPRDRTGSNSEAIMDMIDTYSHLQFGVAKPLMITEYGKIPEGNMGMMDYSAERSAGMLYSINGQHMTFMDHPDRFLKTIPFILGKAMWTYELKGAGEPGQANPFLIWRKNAKGEFVTTDLTLFYEFWKGVEGEWRVATSSNPDVRVQFLVEHKKLHVIFANLAHEVQAIELSGLEAVRAATIKLRELSTHTDHPMVGERSMDKIPTQLTLQPGMGAMLIIDMELPARAKTQVQEYRCYATDYLKAIQAEEAIHFRFNDVPTGKGSAVLRVSPGRELGKAVLPTSITFNGRELDIPSNWAGDDQAGRSAFFGMIEFVVPMELVTSSNEVEIIYPDSGGKIACAVLQVNRIESL